MFTTRRVVTFLLLSLAAAGFVFAGTQKRVETPVSVRDSAVEHVIPADGSPVAVRQARIGVDLTHPHTAVLIINGIEIPEDQLDRNEPLNQVFFQPGAGKVIEELQAGPVTVTAVIWNPVEGTREQDGRPFTWSFGVA
ncbi:MAG TPA: hypothetical protein VMN58_09895 [Acidimicrobiales bacterium]|nr:hypothetical protein [Acidimicrobiales bacterium]